MLKQFLITVLTLCCCSLNLTVAQYYFPYEAAAVPNFGRCITPNRERALCIILQDCKYLYSILTTNPLLESDRVYLSLSQCGYQNGRVLICCPDRYRELPQLPPTPAETPSPVPPRGPTTRPTQPQPQPTSPPQPTSTGSQDLLPRPGQCGNVLSNRIYGGNLTKIDEYPWLALIEYTKPGGSKGHHCGGSLISQRYVITAAHCVKGRSLPTDWRLSAVRLGEWDTTTHPDCEVDVRGEKDCAPEHIDVPVERTIAHPEYQPGSKNQVNDIALLRLRNNIAYTDFVRPICLPVDANLRSATFDGISMDVAGWGQTESVSASSIKLKAAVDGVSLDECRKVYSNEGIELDETQLCAGGEKGIDSCRGDSGGPLISLDTTNKVRVYYFLAGVVSFGPSPCGMEDWPGVYTRVGHFVDWIQQTIRP